MICSIKIKSDSRNSLALTKAERELLSSEVSREIDISWLPVEQKEKKTAGFADVVTIMIYISGVGLASFFKPFVEGALEEAGKDTWIYLKKITAKIFKKQKQKTYRLKGKIYYIVELNDAHVAIPIRVSGDEDLSEEEIMALIGEQLKTINESANDIQDLILEFNVGGTKDTLGLHVIYKKQNGRMSIRKFDDYDDE